MTELVVRGAGEGGREGIEKTPIIDVDVHEGLSSVEELLAYLGEPWRARVEVADGWKGIDTFPYSYPQVNGLVMAEAVTENGAPAGSDYVLMRDQLLDAYDVEYAVLVSALQPTDMRVQPEFAAALASAYNDWLIENWLEKDGRLRGSVTVAAQDPWAAAREIDRVGADPRFVQVILPASTRDVVCRREELEPGTMRAFKVGGRRIAVACLENNTYRAFHDTCPHEMASLARGRVEGMWVSDRVGHYQRSERCVVVCPWHNFEFDVCTGLSLCELGRMRVKTYLVDLESDEVVVYV